MSLFKTNTNKLNEQIELLTSKIESLELENTELRNQLEELSNKDEQISGLQSQLSELQNSVNEKDSRISELESQLSETQIELVESEESASEKAAQIVAGIGIAPIEGVIDEEAVTQTDMSIVDKFKSLKGKEQLEFFQANKDKIFKAISQNR